MGRKEDDDGDVCCFCKLSSRREVTGRRMEGEGGDGEEGERKDSFLSHSLRAAKVLSNLREYGEIKGEMRLLGGRRERNS